MSLSKTTHTKKLDNIYILLTLSEKLQIQEVLVKSFRFWFTYFRFLIKYKYQIKREHTMVLNEMKYFVGEIYTLDPSTVVMDDKYVGFNPLHNEAEKAATRRDIEVNGQQKPIYMLNGKCIDGRHRCGVLADLGRSVYAINLQEGLGEDVYYQIANTDTIAGRNLTATQRTITAYNYKKVVGCSAREAALIFQVTPQNLTYAKAIDGYGLESVLEGLLNGNGVRLVNMDKPSKSLEYICKKAKQLYEEGLVQIDEAERVQFNPESQIKTEQGKALYYSLVNTGIPNSNVELRMHLVEYVNMKFKLPE